MNQYFNTLALPLTSFCFLFFQRERGEETERQRERDRERQMDFDFSPEGPWALEEKALSWHGLCPGQASCIAVVSQPTIVPTFLPFSG